MMTFEDIANGYFEKLIEQKLVLQSEKEAFIEGAVFGLVYFQTMIEELSKSPFFAIKEEKLNVNVREELN